MPDLTLPTSPEELERAARAVLHPELFGYLAGGAGDEITLREASGAWRVWAPRTRVLTDVTARSVGVPLLGRERATPLLVAPMAGQGGVHPTGEIGMARAAAGAGVPYILSTRASIGPSELTAAVPEGTHWLQVYVLTDPAVSAGLIAQARDCGFEALVLTVDLPVFGARDREVAMAYELPHMPAVGHGVEQDPSLSWRDLERLVADSTLPVLVKGILEPTDALRALECGVAGVIVSTHGGRQLDTVIPSALALPEVVSAVAGKVPVLVDGGLRRGTDVLVALALGASAVLIGRPLLWGLALDGPHGAAHVLERLSDELNRALALVGVPNATDLIGAGDAVLREAWWRTQR